MCFAKSGQQKYHGLGIVARLLRWNSWTSNFTKDSSLLLHAIHSSFYWQILKKTILFFGFKPQNKKTSLFMNNILL
jgi:hypothetical protein